MKIVKRLTLLGMVTVSSIASFAQASGGQITRKSVSKKQVQKAKETNSKASEFSNKSFSKPTPNESYYDNEVKKYEVYLANHSDARLEDYEELASLYNKWVEEAEGIKRGELIKKLADVYSMIAEKFPYHKIYYTFQRATSLNKIDKNIEKGIAKADYQRVVALLETKVNRSSDENTMLKYSYHYLMAYTFLNAHNITLAKDYATKILALDPEYDPALQIVNLK